MKIKYKSEVIKQKNKAYSKCSVAISYIAYKRQASLNKNHAHGNDVRPVERKQNCALSEKGPELRSKLSEMLAIKKNTNAKNQRRAKDDHKIQSAEVNKSATKIT